MPLKPIGILGGTFDPVHLGHLHLATSILTNFAVSKIKFIPCYQPVHRPPPQTTVDERVKMLELCLHNHSHFELDLREVLRQEPSYTIDTLISLKTELPQTPLYLLLGADAYQGLTSWKNWQQLVEYAHIIVLNRSDTPCQKHCDSFLTGRETTNISDLEKHPYGKIFFFRTPPCTISATAIRQAVKEGRDISQYVTKEVASFIAERCLYRK